MNQLLALSINDGTGYELLIKLLSIPGLILFFSFRGYFQAWVAKKLGDNTPMMNGFLTMNPLAHIDIFGFICMLIIGFGFGKSIQFNSRNYKNPKRDGAIQILSAPLAGLILAFAELLTYYLLFAIFQFTGLIGNKIIFYILLMVRLAAEYSVFLTVFLFLPLPGFDSYKLIANFLPYNYYRKLYTIEKYSLFIFIGFIILLRIPVIGDYINYYLIDLPTSFLLSILSLPGELIIKFLFR